MCFLSCTLNWKKPPVIQGTAVLCCGLQVRREEAFLLEEKPSFKDRNERKWEAVPLCQFSLYWTLSNFVANAFKLGVQLKMHKVLGVCVFQVLPERVFTAVDQPGPLFSPDRQLAWCHCWQGLGQAGSNWRNALSVWQTQDRLKPGLCEKWNAPNLFYVG